MKRWLLTLAVTGGWLASSVCGQEVRPAANARLVSIEVSLAEFDASLWAGQDAAAAGKLLATLKAAEGQEKVYAFSQMQLSALENQPAMGQWAERVAVPSGRTLSGSGRVASVVGPGGAPSSSTSYTRENLGTLISATCRVDEGGLIVIELNLEQTRMAADTEVKLDASDPDASALLKPVTRTLKTVVSVEDGQTILLGGMTTRSGKQHRQDAILVTARIVGSKPVKAAARTWESPAKSVAAASNTEQAPIELQPQRRGRVPSAAEVPNTRRSS